MRSRQIGAGDDVEAWCTKCQMDLNHRVIAVVDGRPKRVICLTCNSHHNYHPPKSTPTKAAPKARVVSTPRALKSSLKSSEAPARPSGEWKTFMKDYDESSTVKQYSVFSFYAVSDFIEHSVFGLGKVIDITGAQKIIAIFKDGRKTLVCNKTKVTQE